MATTCSARNAPLSRRRAASLTSSGARIPTLNAWACMFRCPPERWNLQRSLGGEPSLDVDHARERGTGRLAHEVGDRLVLERPQAGDELQLAGRLGAAVDQIGRAPRGGDRGLDGG